MTSRQSMPYPRRSFARLLLAAAVAAACASGVALAAGDPASAPPGTHTLHFGAPSWGQDVRYVITATPH